MITHIIENQNNLVVNYEFAACSGGTANSGGLVSSAAPHADTDTSLAGWGLSKSCDSPQKLGLKKEKHRTIGGILEESTQGFC